jgi:hypothetical protein
MGELHRLTMVSGVLAAVLLTVPALGQAPADAQSSAPATAPSPAPGDASTPAPAAAPGPAAADKGAMHDQPATSGKATTEGHGAADAHPASEGGFKRAPAPASAYVYVGWPNDGEVIRSTHFKVWFGTRDFGVAPAGTYKPNTGHHHLLIDTALPPMDQPIPNDKNHLHFGLGQTETFVDLLPGTHTLQILMGDGDHVPHDPPLISKKIIIHVQAKENKVVGMH